VAGFQAMFEGRHPTTGELLGRQHGRNAVPAFDVVLRPGSTTGHHGRATCRRAVLVGVSPTVRRIVLAREVRHRPLELAMFPYRT
jgi:hypothetical protein